MNVKRCYFLLAGLLVLPSILSAQAQTFTGPVKNLQGEEIPLDDLEAFIGIAMEDFEIPGLSLAIINEGKVVYHAVRGVADLAANQPVTAATIFEGASLSKPLFAHFVMTFVEEQKLDLDRPLYEYLPYPDIAQDERYRKITARMVLSHTTGFPNWRTDYPDEKLFIQFEPGTSWHYSGEGYQYLAQVLAHLAETDAKGLESLFQERIAVPLGLTHTRFIQDASNLTHKAKPYKEGKLIASPFNNEDFGAAYGVHTEAVDFSKWIIGLMKQEVLSPESYEELFMDQVRLPEDAEQAVAGINYWTLGFSRYSSPFGDLYTHGGNNHGFSSGFGFHRSEQWGVVYFTNADQVSAFGLELFAFLHE